MNSVKRRLDRLSAAAPIGAPVLVARQDLDHRDIYRDDDGTEYTEAELDRLSNDRLVYAIVYVDDWRGDDEQH